ncbi:hypothetical protein QCA50_004526 [Cerrena zonata]|uniref:Uncharacterized protein n=1 Tax=Cerrena zonata TaxID=2478898 RepID=A0AAW0GJQ5_9APHY
MTSSFAADESKLVSIFVQTLLYGIFSVLFVISIWVLRRKMSGGAGMGATMFGVAVTMWVLATMHLGVNFARIFNAFITYRNEPGGPAAYFYDLSSFTNVFGSAIYITQTLVGDGFVLYRAAIVWNKNLWIIVLPCLLLTGSAVSGGVILYIFAKIDTQTEIFSDQLSHWISSFFALTLATNIICTTLVAFKIWQVNKLSVRVGATNLIPVFFVVIESGALYSMTLIVLLATYLAGSWSQYLLIDALSPIIGIVFSFVIVRLGLSLSSSSETTRSQRDVDRTNFSTNLWWTPDDKPPEEQEVVLPGSSINRMARVDPSVDTLTADTSFSGADSDMFNYPPKKWASPR